MKKFAFRSLLVLVMVIGLALTFVGCPGNDGDDNNEADGHDYKVTVIGVDGNPYTGYAVVEFCCSPAEEEGATCHANSREINENGVAYADNGDDVLGNCTFTAHEIHVRGIPDTLRQKNELTIKKGESGIVYLEENVDDFENGDGTAAAPYGVKCYSNYKVKFTAADQKIYLAFSSQYAEVYKVYSIGSADVKIAQLNKTNDGFEAMGEEFANDNVSATDKNFSYQFTHKEANYTSYFEISLANSADVNKDVIVAFEYVKNYKPE